MIAHSETLQFTQNGSQITCAHAQTQNILDLKSTGIASVFFGILCSHFLGVQSNREIIFQMGHMPNEYGE